MWCDSPDHRWVHLASPFIKKRVDRDSESERMQDSQRVRLVGGNSRESGGTRTCVLIRPLFGLVADHIAKLDGIKVGYIDFFTQFQRGTAAVGYFVHGRTADSFN